MVKGQLNFSGLVEICCLFLFLLKQAVGVSIAQPALTVKLKTDHFMIIQ